MPAVWTYPWTLRHEGVGTACERLAECGIDALNVAGHYHSVRSMQPRFPDDLFDAYPGGCYFDPGEGFDDTPIDPPVNRVGSWDDPLATIVDQSHDAGTNVNAWTVCLHNSRLGVSNPDYRLESAFGDAHDHALCPSHPAVRDYFAAVIEALRERDVDGIHLESVGFPSSFHGHGTAFGHDKRQAATTTAEEALLSQCFCDGCRAAAESHPVEFERARTRVRELVRRSLADPTTPPPPVETLVRQEPAVGDLLDFRASVVDALLGRLADAAGSTPLNYYLMEAFERTASGFPAAGVRFEDLDSHLDRVTALCYVSDPEVARERVATLDRAVDLAVDAGVTLDPGVVDGAEQLGGLVDGIRSATDGTLSFYHHSLATETHLDWLADTLG